MEIDYMSALRNGLGKTAFEGLQDTYFTRGMANQRASYSASLPQDDYTSRMQRMGGQSGVSSQGGIGYSLAEGLLGRLSYSSSATKSNGLYNSAGTSSSLRKECISCGRGNDSSHPKCRSCLDR